MPAHPLEPADDVRCGFSGPGHLCELYGVGRDDTDTAVALLAEATGFTSHRDDDGGGGVRVLHGNEPFRYLGAPHHLNDQLRVVDELKRLFGPQAHEVAAHAEESRFPLEAEEARCHLVGEDGLPW